MSKSLPALHPDDITRLWANIIRRDVDQCWPWVLSTDNHGYGQIRIQGDTYKTHRLAYFITFGEDPNELDVCHDCDNPPCCNPDHLFLGTHQDNMADLKMKGGLVRLKLDIAEVFKLQETMTQRQIAKQLGCSQRTITKILHGIDFHRPIN